MTRQTFDRIFSLRNFLSRKLFPDPRFKKLGCLGNSYISRRAILKGSLSKIYISHGSSIDDYVTLDCNQGRDKSNEMIKIGSNTHIQQFSIISAHGGKIEIGQNCSINPFCVLYGLGGLTIGNFVRIATHTVIVPANHVFDDPNMPITLQELSKKGVVIEDDVWIGTGVRILDGVKVGRGSVIGAGTVLTRSVDPFSVVVGVPGRIIRKRGEGIVS